MLLKEKEDELVTGKQSFWKLFYYIAIYSQLSIDLLLFPSTFSLDHRKCLKNRGKCYMGHPVYVYLYLHIRICVCMCAHEAHPGSTIVVQSSKQNPRCADRSRNRLLETSRTYRFGFYQLVFDSCA